MYCEVNSERWLSLEDFPNEIWVDVKGYENLYLVSNYGRVKSLERYSRYNNRRYQTKIIKCHYNTKKYLDVELSNNEFRNRYRIHRLVAEAFIPNPENKPQVNHKDGNKANNHVDNLEWCNNSENQKHAFANGLNKRGMYGSSPKAKRVVQYSLNGSLIREWDSIIRIYRELGYSDAYISSCCKGKCKQAYGYIWKYKEVN